MSGWESEQEAKENSVNWCTEEQMKNFDARYLPDNDYSRLNETYDM